MEGRTLDRVRRATGLALALGLLTAVVPAAGAVAASEPAALPDCAELPSTVPLATDVEVPWQTVLDADGIVVEHRMTVRRDGVDTTIRAGRRGFAVPVSDRRVVIGERSAGGTTLTLVDAERLCRVWQRQLDRLAYDITAQSDSGVLRLTVHDPLTRRFEGEVLIETETGATEAMIDGECSTTCAPNDGELLPAAFGPVGPARPVPAFAAGGWPLDRSLGFSWQAGEQPPAWARPAITAAAADASETSKARSPQYGYRAGADETVRYTSSFPTFCRFGIACASRNLPAFWAMWLRPHGTDFSWGTLRWCQREDGSGCFDLRRVILHELGHVNGLDHPSAEGFRLAANETVMHDITPAKPSAGSTRHAFGRCDVATLQELYDVPSNSTPISSCNDVATELTLSASRLVIGPGESVRLRAVLRVADRSPFGLLAGNTLDGRSVRLKYRRSGSGDAWTSLWLEPQASFGRYDLTITPTSNWEFQAAFPAPAGEGLRFSSSAIVKVRVQEEVG